jgi:RNA polymerase sigma factor (sigma-70 family)
MLRRAFREAFDGDELDDIYASAWVGTLRALESRHDQLSDDEIRSYVFTAVAHQAGKELRRRKRKPIAPLELAATVADSRSRSPEDSAATAEESRVTRDLLASLPARRRAVILLRYGWGLEPKQICTLIKGLSPRAYRKEITRGVDELTEKIRRFEAGKWCNDREPVLKTYAAGLASVDEERQAQAHLAHCRACSDFVARLSGHLRDLGSAIAVPATVDGIDGQLSLGDRLVAVGDRAREAAAGVLGRGDGSAAEEAAAMATSGGGKGAGAAGAGLLAKLAGLGAAGKLALACAGGTAALTACVAAGIGPVHLRTDRTDPAVETTAPGTGPDIAGTVQPSPPVNPPPAPPDPAHPTTGSGQGVDSPREGDGEGGDSQSAPVADPAPPPAPTATTPVAPTTPPAEQEFGAAAAAAPVQPASSSDAAAPSSGGTSGATVRQEFGP